MPTDLAEAGTTERSAPSGHVPAPAPTRARRISRRVAADLVALADALAIAAGTIAAGIAIATLEGAPADLGRITQLSLVAAVIGAILLARQTGRDPGRLHALPVSVGRLLFAHTVAQGAVVGLLEPGQPAMTVLAAAVAIGSGAGFGLGLLVRHGARRVLARLAATGAFDARVAVYGSGAVASRVERHLADPALCVAFAGRFDDRSDATRQEPGAEAPDGSLADLVVAARAGTVDQIVIALPQSASGRTDGIVRRLEHLPVRISIVTHIASDIVAEGPAHRVASLGPVGLLTVKGKPLDGWGTVVKAAEDYVLGAVLLLLALPVMALVALAVRLDSPGPIIFRQRRRGLNSEVFEVLKFRTMRVLEDGATVTQARRGDPRVTRVGRYLRASSLDELPQLWNVLRGEMSLVGPRPHAVAHDDHFSELIRRYPSRQQVKPGITGLAQVRGHRGETETPEKMQARLEQDLAYVAGWSLWLDLEILALTVVRVWGGRNAY